MHFNSLKFLIEDNNIDNDNEEDKPSVDDGLEKDAPATEPQIKQIKKILLSNINKFAKQKIKGSLDEDLGIFTLQNLNSFSRIPILGKIFLSPMQTKGAQKKGTTSFDVMQYEKMQVIPFFLFNKDNENINAENSKEDYNLLFLVPVVGAKISPENVEKHKVLFSKETSNGFKPKDYYEEFSNIGYISDIKLTDKELVDASRALKTSNISSIKLPISKKSTRKSSGKQNESINLMTQNYYINEEKNIFNMKKENYRKNFSMKNKNKILNENSVTKEQIKNINKKIVEKLRVLAPLVDDEADLFSLIVFKESELTSAKNLSDLIGRKFRDIDIVDQIKTKVNVDVVIRKLNDRKSDLEAIAQKSLTSGSKTKDEEDALKKAYSQDVLIAITSAVNSLIGGNNSLLDHHQRKVINNKLINESILNEGFWSKAAQFFGKLEKGRKVGNVMTGVALSAFLFTMIPGLSITIPAAGIALLGKLGLSLSIIGTLGNISKHLGDVYQYPDKPELFTKAVINSARSELPNIIMTIIAGKILSAFYELKEDLEEIIEYDTVADAAYDSEKRKKDKRALKQNLNPLGNKIYADIIDSYYKFKNDTVIGKYIPKQVIDQALVKVMFPDASTPDNKFSSLILYLQKESNSYIYKKGLSLLKEDDGSESKDTASSNVKEKREVSFEINKLRLELIDIFTKELNTLNFKRDVMQAIENEFKKYQGRYKLKTLSSKKRAKVSLEALYTAMNKALGLNKSDVNAVFGMSNQEIMALITESLSSEDKNLLFERYENILFKNEMLIEKHAKARNVTSGDYTRPEELETGSKSSGSDAAYKKPVRSEGMTGDEFDVDAEDLSSGLEKDTPSEATTISPDDVGDMSMPEDSAEMSEPIPERTQSTLDDPSQSTSQESSNTESESQGGEGGDSSSNSSPDQQGPQEGTSGDGASPQNNPAMEDTPGEVADGSSSLSDQASEYFDKGYDKVNDFYENVPTLFLIGVKLGLMAVDKLNRRVLAGGMIANHLKDVNWAVMPSIAFSELICRTLMKYRDQLDEQGIYISGNLQKLPGTSGRTSDSFGSLDKLFSPKMRSRAVLLVKDIERDFPNTPIDEDDIRKALEFSYKQTITDLCISYHRRYDKDFKATFDEKYKKLKTKLKDKEEKEEKALSPKQTVYGGAALGIAGTGFGVLAGTALAIAGAPATALLGGVAGAVALIGAANLAGGKKDPEPTTKRDLAEKDIEVQASIKKLSSFVMSLASEIKEMYPESKAIYRNKLYNLLFEQKSSLSFEDIKSRLSANSILVFDFDDVENKSQVEDEFTTAICGLLDDIYGIKISGVSDARSALGLAKIAAAVDKEATIGTPAVEALSRRPSEVGVPKSISSNMTADQFLSLLNCSGSENMTAMLKMMIEKQDETLKLLQALNNREITGSEAVKTVSEESGKNLTQLEKDLNDALNKAKLDIPKINIKDAQRLIATLDKNKEIIERLIKNDKTLFEHADIKIKSKKELTKLITIRFNVVKEDIVLNKNDIAKSLYGETIFEYKTKQVDDQDDTYNKNYNMYVLHLLVIINNIMFDQYINLKTTDIMGDPYVDSVLNDATPYDPAFDSYDANDKKVNLKNNLAKFFGELNYEVTEIKNVDESRRRLSYKEELLTGSISDLLYNQDVKKFERKFTRNSQRKINEYNETDFLKKELKRIWKIC